MATWTLDSMVEEYNLGPCPPGEARCYNVVKHGWKWKIIFINSVYFQIIVIRQDDLCKVFNNSEELANWLTN